MIGGPYGSVYRFRPAPAIFPRNRLPVNTFGENLPPAVSRDMPSGNLLSACSQKCLELVHSQPGLTNDCPKRSLGHLVMVGNCQPPVCRVCLPKHDVAATLMIELVPNTLNLRSGMTAQVEILMEE